MFAISYSDYDDVYRKCGNISTNDVTTAVITAMIVEADAYIERRIGKTWATSSTQTDYFDTQDNDYQRSWMDEGGIVTGSKPFFDSRPQFSLKNRPVNSVTDVWLLERDSSLNNVFVYDSSAGTYTDNTTEANSVGGTPFNAFASTVAIGDILYVGNQYRFLAVTINLVTDGVGGVLVWEYYNGSSWTTLSVTEGTSDADDLNAGGEMTWSLPRDWDSNSVDGSENYWVRLRVATAHSTTPTVRNVFMDNDTVIYKEIAPYNYTWDREGRLILRDDSVSADMRRLRVNYYAGRDAGSTFPNSNEERSVQELSATLAGINVMVYLMGGSYDDATSYSVGDIQISKGEPWTNLRATIVHLERRREELFNNLGVDVAFFAT